MDTFVHVKPYALAEYLLLFKSLHIVGFVAWFGGLFYLVRILVYHTEALERPEKERAVLIPQFSVMEKRVYRIICNPGMMITWTFGTLLLVIYGAEWLRTNPWMHVKLVLLVVLTAYHMYCKRIMNRMGNRKRSLNSFQLRLLNEIPTVLLVAIVLLAVYRNLLNFGLAFLGVSIFGILLYVFTRWYRRIRSTN